MVKKSIFTKASSILVAFAMLVCITSAALIPSAAVSVTVTPVPYETLGNGGWFEPDTGAVSIAQIDATHVADLTQGTYYYMFGRTGTYTVNSASTVAIVTIDGQGNVSVKDGSFTLNSWDSSPVTELSSHNAIAYKQNGTICLQWGGIAPPSVEDPDGPYLKRVAITVMSSLELDHMGYGNALTAGSAFDDETLHTVHAAGTVYLQPGDDYLFYMVKGKAGNWYFNTYSDCVRIKVNERGAVTTSGAKFDWNGVSNTDTLNYVIEPSIGGVMLNYQKDTAPQAIVTSEMQGVIEDGGVYGPGVPDSIIDEWARVGNDVAATAEGSDRQTFSVNSVKNLLSAFSAKPARSISTVDFGVKTQEYYREQKELNSQYMKHENYAYSDYFIHDYYIQGIWDTMPATYGWMQDQYTTPGKIIMKKMPELKGLAHGIGGGGQNPYIVCDYLERMAATESTPAVAGTAGEGWFKGYDEESQNPYLWNPDQGVFLSYDNEESLNARADYINDKDLAGVIIWELSGDNTAYYDMTRIFKEKLKDNGKQVIAYFVNWSVYNKYHQQQTPDMLPWDKLTCINYSFYQIGGYSETAMEYPANTLQSVDTWADDYKGDYADNAPNMLLDFDELKAQYPDVDILVSVGGWTRGDAFGTMVETKENRTTFIESVIDFMNTYTFFDGVDLDWEYPGFGREPDYDDPNDQGVSSSSDDFKNYADFVSELRVALDAEFGDAGRNVITACAPGSSSKLDKQDLPRLVNDLTYLNMMTYDYHGAFDPTIGYNSPLFAHDETPDEWSTQTTVDYLESRNIDLSKVNVGAAFYSRGWAGVIPDEDGNPAPLADPTPIFNSTVVVPPVEEEEVMEFAMKTDYEYAYINGTVSKTDGSNNDGQGMYYPKLRFVGSSVVLPLRYVAESVGLDVGYDIYTGLTTITDGKTTVKIIQDSSDIIVVKNGKTETINIGTIAETFHQVVHIPVRGVLTQFEDLTVKYDYMTGIVTVTDYDPDTNEFSALIAKAQKALA